MRSRVRTFVGVACVVAWAACIPLDELSSGSMDGSTSEAAVPEAGMGEAGPSDVSEAGPPDVSSEPTDKLEGGDAEGGDSGCQYRAIVLADNPVAYWRLGESGGTAAVDEVQGGPQGAYLPDADGGIQFGAKGAIACDTDTAIHLDGLSAVDAGSVFAFAGNQSYSLEAWINPDPTDAGQNDSYHAIFDHTTANGTDGYSLDNTLNSGGLMTYLVVDGSAYATVSQVLTNLPGLFYHVVNVYDATADEMLIYVNGITHGSRGGQPALAGKPAPFVLGAPQYGTGLAGYLDEVAVYTTALQQSQVLKHYNAGIAH